MANEYLKRVPTSTGNRRVFTWAGWVKLNNQNVTYLLTATPVKDNNTQLFINSAGQIYFFNREGSDATTDQIKWDPYFRDMGSWKHIIINADTTQASAADRVRCYVNGVLINRDETASKVDNVVNVDTPPKDQEFWRLNGSGYEHYIGASLDNSLNALNGNQFTDVFYVDGQQLGPDVFGFYKEGDGYVSAGSTQATDFRPGQWVPKRPRVIKTEIERRGGFGVNGFYLPMNDSSNPGADFHCDPNSIITLKGEDLPQPRNGAPTTSDAYVSQLRSDANAANLVLAVAGASTVIGADIVNNGYEWTGASGTTAPTGWSAEGGVATYAVNSSGQLVYDRNGDSGTPARFSQDLETVDGNTYYLTLDLVATTVGGLVLDVGGTTNVFSSTTATGIKRYRFTATSSTTTIAMRNSSATGTLTIDNVKVRQVDAVPRDYSADIKGSGSNKTLTSNGQPGVGLELGGYYGSAMTFDGTGDSLQGPLNSSDLEMGSDDFTVEAWVNPSDVSGPGGIAGIWDGSSNDRSWLLYHGSGGGLNFIISADGSGNDVVASGISMTTGQWYHVVGEKEGTTIRIIVNGVVAAIDTAAAASVYNASEEFRIGIYDFSDSTPQHFAGHIQDVRVYKGVAKYKGGFDVPKPYTPVGIESWRTVSDCTANNFATLNPLASRDILSNGSLTAAFTSAAFYNGTISNFMVNSGKWYCEVRFDEESTGNIAVGVHNLKDMKYIYGGSTFFGGEGGSNDFTVNNGVRDSPAAVDGDIIQMKLDLDSSPAVFSVAVNGGTYTDFESGVESGYNYLKEGETYGFVAADVQSGVTGIKATFNFGQNPSFSGQTTAGTNTDSNGKGLFMYAPPSGFLALCEDNLPTPAIADPGEHFKTVLYTGDGNAGLNISGVGFQPDMVWIKNRSSARSHNIYDSVRGPAKRIQPDLTNVETDIAGVSAFNLNGFSLGNGTDDTNYTAGENYVAWCWKAGGPAVSNTDGSITSQVSANQDAGFSIVTWLSNAAPQIETMGHGLGKSPDFMIVKNRDYVYNWWVWHKDLSNTTRGYLRLDENVIEQTGGNDTWSVSSTTFGLRQSSMANANTDDFVAYCWTEIEGYSKFGRWYGNGDPDGPFVYCGFKPAFIMSKRTDSATNGNWTVFDSSRDSTNPVGAHFRADATNEELFFGSGIDIVSNGFKIREAASALNNGSGTYIFMAFAESPFKTANAK